MIIIKKVVNIKKMFNEVAVKLRLKLRIKLPKSATGKCQQHLSLNVSTVTSSSSSCEVLSQPHCYLFEPMWPHTLSHLR